MRCPVLVGRTAELRFLERAVEQAETSAGAWITVFGEAGMGKSRVVAEFARWAATAAGCRPVTGRCSMVDRSTAYRPLAEAALAMAADLPMPVADEIAPFAAALARFVPQWCERDLIASESAAVLGESLLRLLRWRSRDRPAVLLLEDLHWADVNTLAVCEYLADHAADSHTVVVATCRPDEAPAPAQRTLGRHASLKLPPLSPEEVAEVAAECLGQTPSREALERLATVAHGLPLLVEDLLDVESGVPARFTALVAERLHRMPESSQPVVVAAALLGERFELPLLAAAHDGPAADLTGALTDALSAGLMVADEGTFRFRHALTHEAVLAAVPALRAAMTVGVAAALETDGSARNLSRAADLRAAAGDPATAATLYERAAVRVAQDGTPGAALALLDLARSLATDDSRQRIDRARLRHLAALGRAAEVERLGNDLLDSVTGEDERAVRLTLAGASLDAGDPQRATSHLDALAGDRHDDPAVLVLRARLALQTSAGDRRLIAEHLAHQAIAASRDRGASACEALELAARCARGRSLDDASGLLQRALDIAERDHLAAWRLRILNELGTVEMLRRADGARLQRALTAARAAGALDVATAIAVNIAALHAMRGELDDAAAQARAAHQEALRLGLRPLAAAALVMEALTFGFRGDREPLERRLRAARELAPSDADLDAFAWGAGRGLCALLREERDDAVEAFGRAVQDDVPVGSLDTGRGPRLLLLELLGDASPADRAAAQATATPGAGWSDLWLGYAAAVAAGRDRRPDGAAKIDVRAGRRGRPPPPAVSGHRPAARGRGRHRGRLGRPGGVAPRGRRRVRDGRPGPHRIGLPRPAEADRRARHPAAGPRPDTARQPPSCGRHGAGGRGAQPDRRPAREQGDRGPTVPVPPHGREACRQPAAEAGRRRPSGAGAHGLRTWAAQDGGVAPMFCEPPRRILREGRHGDARQSKEETPCPSSLCSSSPGRTSPSTTRCSRWAARRSSSSLTG